MKVLCISHVLCLAVLWRVGDAANIVGAFGGVAKSVATELNPIKQSSNDNTPGVKEAFSNLGKSIAKEYNETSDAVGDFSNKTEESVSDAFSGAGKAIGKEVAAVKTPIEEALVYVGSSQCSNVKRIIGVEYDQVDDVNEPDLNQLNLQFRSKLVNISYKLSDAARLVPAQRGYNPRSKLILFMHGFTDDPASKNFGQVSEAFLKIGEYSILGLDSSSLIKWLYLRSTTYIRFIGEKLGEMLAVLVKQKGLDPNSIHLVGHSLGAHISGFAGKTFENLTGSLVGRITGLDPAGPCFSHVDPDLRLKATDGRFVDVIHTDAGVYGLNDNVGQVDFWPNGGSQQPGCVLQTCSHSRAVQLFAESITRTQAFPGLQCQSWNQFRENKCTNKLSVMGYASPPEAKGSFFMQTADEAPFGLEKGGLRFINNEGVIRNIGTGIANTFG